jgi:hypothetical protein
MVRVRNFHEETEFTTEAGRNGVVNLTKQFQKWIRLFSRHRWFRVGGGHHCVICGFATGSD